MRRVSRPRGRIEAGGVSIGVAARRRIAGSVRRRTPKKCTACRVQHVSPAASTQGPKRGTAYADTRFSSRCGPLHCAAVAAAGAGAGAVANLASSFRSVTSKSVSTSSSSQSAAHSTSSSLGAWSSPHAAMAVQRHAVRMGWGGGRGGGSVHVGLHSRASRRVPRHATGWTCRCARRTLFLELFEIIVLFKRLRRWQRRQRRWRLRRRRVRRCVALGRSGRRRHGDDRGGCRPARAGASRWRGGRGGL